MKDATLAQGNQMLNLILQKQTPSEQLQRLMESGLFSDLLEANLENGIDRDAFRRLVGLKPLNSPLLESLGTVTVPATAERFIARKRFVAGRKAPVKISFLGGNFKNWFLDKVEGSKSETQLRYAKLTKYSVDGPILAELGNTAESTLAEVYALVECQPNGENGVLLTNGYANIFYVRDVNGELRAVLVDWHGDGWRVGADSVSDPLEWDGGLRVFSRNSCNP